MVAAKPLRMPFGEFGPFPESTFSSVDEDDSYQFRLSPEWHKFYRDNDFLCRFTFSCKNLDRLLCLL